MPATTCLDKLPVAKEPGGPKSKTALAVYQAGASSVLRAVHSLKMIVARQTTGPDAGDNSGCAAFDGQSVNEYEETAAAKGGDMCLINNTESDSCNDAEVNGTPHPPRNGALSRNGVPGSEEGSKPDPEDNNGPPTRKFRWAVTVEEEEQVRERVWKKMEQELEQESSSENPWDSATEQKLELVTRRREIQDAKRLEELRKERNRKMRSMNLRLVVNMATAGMRISDQASWARHMVYCAKVIQRAYRARLENKRDAAMRQKLDPNAEIPMLTPAEWKGGWQGISEPDTDEERPANAPLERSLPAPAQISEPKGTTVVIYTPDDVILKAAAAMRKQEPAAVEALETSIIVERSSKSETVAMRPLPAPTKQQPVNRPNTTPAPAPAADPGPTTPPQEPKPKPLKRPARAPNAAPARPPAPAPPRVAATPSVPTKPSKPEPKPKMQQASIQSHVMSLPPSHTTSRVATRRARDDNYTDNRRSLDSAPRNEAREQRDIPVRRRPQVAASPLSLFQFATQDGPRVAKTSQQQPDPSSRSSMPWDAAHHHPGKSDIASHPRTKTVPSKSIGFSMDATEEAPSLRWDSTFSGTRHSLDARRPPLALKRGQSSPTDGDILDGQSLESVCQAVRPKSAGRETGQPSRSCFRDGAAPQASSEEQAFCDMKPRGPQRKCKSEYSSRNGVKLPEISVVSPTLSSSPSYAASASSPASASSSSSGRGSLSSSWGDASMTSGYHPSNAIISPGPGPYEPESLVPRRRKSYAGHPCGEPDQNVGPCGLSKSSEFGTGFSSRPPSGGMSKSDRGRRRSLDPGLGWPPQMSSHNDDVFSVCSGPASPIWDPTPDRCLPNTVFKPRSKSMNPSRTVVEACQGEEPYQKPPTGFRRCSTAASQGDQKIDRGIARSAAPSPRDAPSMGFGIASKRASGGLSSPFAPGGTGALVPSTRKTQNRRTTFEY